ncbi:NUDIX hydrolase [Ornithinibacillus xuwenensis]|uniref:NUDIX domain-containing protein n=1 Tax=Ornithinibacillus xuwenensis TaxID=3144668 RepID=A0ABU9XHK9_9BACI
MKPAFGEKLTNINYVRRKSAYVIILSSHEDCVLTVHNGKGYHFLPGGGIERNETDKECIMREMLEETGYTAALGQFIGNALNYFVSSKQEYILNDGNFYIVELGKKVQEPTELDHQLAWVRLEDLQDLMFYAHQVWAVNKAIRGQ